jgi:hypothetical protein
MILTAVYTSDGCEGRCDAKCYNATEPHCEPICGGANHSAGLAQATENTRRYAEAWLAKYAGERNLTEYRGELGQAVQQLDLFSETEGHMDHTQTSLAGEFYVLAQLMQRGLVATLTLANTKGVDILVSNPELNRLFKIEVKNDRGRAAPRRHLRRRALPYLADERQT